MFFNLFINDLLEKHSTQSEESESPELFNTQISFLLFADDLAIFSKMFKYFQRFPFIETNRYLFKAIKEEEFDTKGWVQNLKSLRQNIYRIINGIIPKEEYKSTHKFFKKRATGLYLQIFYNYFDNTKNKGFFTCLKDKHAKKDI